MLKKIDMLSYRAKGLVAFFVGFAPLSFALISQYGFGFQPCHLCVLQRYPYTVVMVLALAVVCLVKHVRYYRILFYAMMLTCAVDASIAAYHISVEQHWIAGPTGCTASGGGEMSIEELRAQIMGTPIAMCDNPTAMWLGVSMAGWNMLYALVATWFLWCLGGRKKEVSDEC